MKTIRIQISESERQELFLLRQKSGDYRSERALAVLHCADGKRPRQIADMLKRSSQAICQWLHAYQKDGLAGLDKDYSPGRPSVRKEKLIPHLSEYLAKSPRDFGWGEDVWSVKVLMAQLKKENGFAISRYTIIRALYDGGFKHCCINNYINNFQIPNPTFKGVASLPLIFADMTFLTRLRSSEIPPLIVLAA